MQFSNILFLPHFWSFKQHTLSGLDGCRKSNALLTNNYFISLLRLIYLCFLYATTFSPFLLAPPAFLLHRLIQKMLVKALEIDSVYVF